MRKIIVYIATSADGYIARPDGCVDWLNEYTADYGMGEFYKTIDTILWGRKTYDFGVSHGPGFDSNVKNYVFSRNPPATAAPGVEFVTEGVSPLATRLRNEPGRDIWMMGGAEIIASFLDKGQIDEFIIHVFPVFIGEGIPLISPRQRAVALALRSCRHFPDGVVRLHYSILSADVRIAASGGTRPGHPE